jgi:hypothetical protein
VRELLRLGQDRFPNEEVFKTAESQIAEELNQENSTIQLKHGCGVPM